ncbi:hypothetical protein J2W24_006038 [Variovorax boronicumulans]|uniref:hypothetical protein n=1 Tax=Variovorax boronicumulans TaxID=436515 RepID=UPI002780562E|nr:hypothetical protein [Variovorax boronicumulans]MDP9920356.1 hypothetical protein [Variovorax boronicumulans]
MSPQQVIPGHGGVFIDVERALQTARKRLSGLERDPEKHARHAMKVLMKFKLLELHAVSHAEWDAWLAGTPYFELIRARFFAGESLEALAGDLLSELIAVGAAQSDALGVRNA